MKRVNIDEALMELTSRVDDGMRLILEMDEFESSLTDQERIAFRMKRHGYTNREIIPYVGVAGEPQMSRLMKTVKNKACAYFAG
ncbi:MAG: hypothetical protein ACI4MF_12115 [Candidatus Faecivicinus sp.]